MKLAILCETEQGKETRDLLKLQKMDKQESFLYTPFVTKV